MERASPALEPTKEVKLQLHDADFTTAARIADTVNHHFIDTPAIAHAENSGMIKVAIPPAFATRTTEFIAEGVAVGDVVPIGWQVEHVRALDPLLDSP